MRFLIDGYNLVHAMGVLSGRTGPTVLQKARLALLGLLASAYQDKGEIVTVVFDAAHAPAGTREEFTYRGIRIRFAIHEHEADDLIESLVQDDSAPRQLTVVSNDHRIKDAAQRRQCKVVGCGEYLESLACNRREQRAACRETSVKPERIPLAETKHWLREFADLETDPNLKALSDPLEWKEL
jgi:predicted RNA-binding protein with PIN domain